MTNQFSQQMFYTFIAAIPGAKKPIGDWKLDFAHQLNEIGFDLAENEQLLYQGELIGFYKFFTLEEAKDVFGSESWFPVKNVCPWFQDVVGYFNWTHIIDYLSTKLHLIPMLIEMGVPNIIRTDNRVNRLPVKLQEFPIMNLTSNHGFMDGDVFLSREKKYLDYVYEQITDALNSAGLQGDIIILETAHNPMRLHGRLSQNGKPLDDFFLIFTDLKVKFWAYDWSILNDEYFWEE